MSEVLSVHPIFPQQTMEVNAPDSNSSHASCENAEGLEDENADILVTQLDINVLMAALLEEKCVSLEQDGDRGRKLFAGIYNYLEKNGVVKPLGSERENLLHTQKQILDKIMQTMAQNASEEDLSGASETTSTTALSTRYRNDFKQIKKLGQGGFGAVYEAKHNLDGRTYAVKKINLRQDTDIAKPLREVKALARLKHTNIMGYHTSWVEDYSCVSASAGTSSDESEGSSESFSTSNSDDNALQEPDKNIKRQPVKKDKQLLCIQMELCNCTLQDWLEERNNTLQKTCTLDYETLDLHPLVKHIFRGILRGVSFIHSRGLMHRDLKPQNIFLMGSNLHAKIGDFGLIKSVNGSDSICSSPTVEGIPVDFNTTTRNIGSEMYGSPELLSGQKCNTKCDMYSLGVLLFEMSNTFTTGMERIEVISELRKKNLCPGKLRKIWSELKIQLIEDLINPVAELRPTAEEVLKNPLFDTERQILQQNVLLLNQQISVEARKDKKPGQKGVKQDQKSKNQVQTNAVELSRDASSDAQLMGFTNKKKK